MGSENEDVTLELESNGQLEEISATVISQDSDVVTETEVEGSQEEEEEEIVDLAQSDNQETATESSSSQETIVDEQFSTDMQVDNESSSEEMENKDDSVTSPSSKAANSDVESEGSVSSESEEVPKKKRKTSTNGKRVGPHPQTLKKSREAFIQSKSCTKLKFAIGKCMECKFIRSPHRVNRKDDSICRFYSFRKLRYTERGSMTVAGFPDCREYTEEDLILWMPDKPPEGLSFELARYLLEEVGDQFCELVKQEKEALVCVSCCKTRISNNTTLAQSHSGAKNSESKDNFGWLKCHLKNDHAIEDLMVTQIVAGKALDDLWTMSHDIRKKLRIPQGCCGSVKSEEPISVVSDSTTLIVPIPQKNNVEDNGTTTNDTHVSEGVNGDDVQNDTSANVSNGTTENESNNTITNGDNNDDDDDDDDSDDDNVLNLIAKSYRTSNIISATSNSNDFTSEPASPTTEINTTVPSKEINREGIPDVSLNQTVENNEMELKNFIRREGSSTYSIKIVAKKVLSLAESTRKYPSVKHSWLCSGYLLRLLEPTNPGNLQMFQEQWKRGQPVIVSNVSSKLDNELWSPESFSRDFGSKSNDLINCMTGKVVPGQKMKRFWDGFEKVKSRLKDDNGQPMLLKLKDWPPGHDFAEMLPHRFADLMKALPLEEYTHRDGKLNLAARLPEIFSKPDLGPKMYIAYGSGLHLDKGTTNLHLDISDAVNVVVYVGVIKDEDNTEHNNAVMNAIEESDCDTVTINRIRKNKELPGALWHIWEAKDADKIRDMLNKVAIETGRKVERYHDAIHDQSWYLDRKLRKRLREEYNVSGYPILQCEGDAVFIPAGAPHQVRNLNNCIKIAEDFVSPENVGHCFHLTEEFRNLTDTHTNHEDKLQIKNIVYHTVKDAVAVIQEANPDSEKE
ncbi:Lysine-specific demethylase 3A [Orchesella cincta]|uniref:[histone H3]-dimethyl-L-lysine(9) demethylase n=1 Tax=Orchesella cincta TaxID=48709 RepID=A0A1D2MND1_ORCCI|nr:Lysine-specific demethylase 3A [Orchesella cincta]